MIQAFFIPGGKGMILFFGGGVNREWASPQPQAF